MMPFFLRSTSSMILFLFDGSCSISDSYASVNSSQSINFESTRSTFLSMSSILLKLTLGQIKNGITNDCGESRSRYGSGEQVGNGTSAVANKLEIVKVGEKVKCTVYAAATLRTLLLLTTRITRIYRSIYDISIFR
jgi:hypothetical protein